MVLPCKHPDRLRRQAQSAIDLLTNLDKLHPDVLRKHGLKPSDYQQGLVFRSAIESIRESAVAASVQGREGLVRDVLDDLVERAMVMAYQRSSGARRTSYLVAVERDLAYKAALEVKGGESGRIHVPNRPRWANEFAVWCHLDGPILKQPAAGARSIVNRLTADIVRRRKQVDVLFFKDVLCGTRARPCPKYGDRAEEIGPQTAPDIFLFPQRIPSPDDPQPPVHRLDTLKLPALILKLFRVSDDQLGEHIWQVQVRLEVLADGRHRRTVQVWRKGELVHESQGRAWRP